MRTLGLGWTQFIPKWGYDSDQKKDRSLRRDKAKNSFEEGGESVSGSGLSVTKGFQEHVAKKLSESIEK